MEPAYHDAMRSLQDRFDTRRLADRLDERLARAAFTADDLGFIESRRFFFLASADALVHGCEAETFCLVAAEARASGTPMIVPDRGAVFPCHCAAFEVLLRGQAEEGAATFGDVRDAEPRDVLRRFR